ncbi:MAG TPA: ABC transporter [Verrucomicrobia bacterium]|nr:MAG: ABC transporter [Lentisphaerae bacterium GWF2_57_35]HBA85780.1 ABC transporter [Verrucomicrobiota bacterium]
MPEQPPPTIDIQRLSKRFGEFKAVDDLSLQIPQGEVFCFLGPNGAGKTTTIKMLCGLLKPSAGTIRIAGFDIQTQAANIKQITGYIPDQPYLYERLTSEEYAQFTADLFQTPRPLARERLDQYFELFGLNEYRAALVKDLSHGLRQRLVYASTFIHAPQVLFVDEPFIGLDPYSIRTIRTLLREKAAGGMTIFLTTHILALAEDLADRVGIIHNGRLTVCGTPAELMERHTANGNLEDVFMKLTSA